MCFVNNTGEGPRIEFNRMTSLVAAGYGCSSSEDDNSDKETNEEEECNDKCDKDKNINYESSNSSENSDDSDDSDDTDDDENGEYTQKSL